MNILESRGTPKAGSKRSLNRSIDTPRILKHLRDSATPKNITSEKKISEQEHNDPMRTPRNVKEIIPSRSPSPSSSLEVLSNDDDDIIAISSREATPSPPPTPRQLAPKVVKQTTLDSMIFEKKSKIPEAVREQDKPVDIIEVSLYVFEYD